MLDLRDLNQKNWHNSVGYLGVHWFFMKNRNLVILLATSVVMAGCASQSSKVISNLDSSSQVFQSSPCENARQNAWLHDEAQKNKLWVGPSVILLAGPIAVLPVFVSNVGLNTADRMQANDIATRCGGNPKSQQQMTTDIALDATMSLALGAVVPATLPTKITPP